MEEWKPIIVTKKGKVYDYSGLYEVSTLGRIRNGKGELLKPCKYKTGYLQVCLYKHGKPKPFLVHRTVAQVFIPNPYGYTDVNHIDENKENNSVDNLEWIPHKKNVQYSQSKKVICLETKQVFDSIQEANAWAKVKTGVADCCKGKQKTAGGFHWQYYDEDDKKEVL